MILPSTFLPSDAGGRRPHREPLINYGILSLMLFLLASSLFASWAVWQIVATLIRSAIAVLQ
jgi:hypothetical protein